MSAVWSDRFARAFGILRGAMLIFFSTLLIVVPEKVMPGSSTDPARRLALFFTGRIILLGLVLAGLAILGKRRGLAWVLFADAALQLFDTGMALGTQGVKIALVPLTIGALDAWAGLVLLRLANKQRSSHVD
jgi:hypothetical protein